MTQEALRSYNVTLSFWRKPGAVRAIPSETQSRLKLFEEIILPHLDAAHNLARWLTRSEADAQDVVQESCLRAYRYFDGYQGGDSKSWLLSIVRNTCRTWQRRQSRESENVPFDEVAHTSEGCAPNQEESVTRNETSRILRACIEKLPAEFREVLVMRELEEMSYREIAEVTGVAIGTVMSRLSRARKRLEECAGTSTVRKAG
jgi:RNA polymerase sigma-70 factor, ECF subfamily